MAESEAELKSVLMRLKEVKEESGNAGLNINIKKQKLQHTFLRDKIQSEILGSTGT